MFETCHLGHSLPGSRWVFATVNSSMTTAVTGADARVPLTFRNCATSLRASIKVRAMEHVHGLDAVPGLPRSTR